MILHIFTAGPGFIDLALHCFAEAGVAGKFYIIGDMPKAGPPPPRPGVTFILLHSPDYRQFLQSLVGTQGLVVFHGLLDTNLGVAKDVQSIPNRSFKIGWVIYGAEVQYAQVSVDLLHGPVTRRVFYRLKPLRYLLAPMKFLPGSHRRRTRAAIQGMDYFIHFIPEEIDVVEQELGITRPRLWSTYAMIEDFIGEELSTRYVTGEPNVMIGNSASFASNHLEVLERMQGQLAEDATVIVPLSYGNKPYGDYLIAEATKTLGTQFVPITKFMPRHEYNELLLSCAVLLMNHYRQQGLGVIVTALWMGSRVHLNANTSTYQFLKRLGIHVFTIEAFFEHRENGKIKVEPLPKELIDHNRVVLRSIFGSTEVAQQIRASFEPFL